MTTNNSINLQSAGVVTYNGTGTFTGNTLTNHSILVGAASNLITNLGVASNGQIPIGSTGADPVLATITAGTGVSITNGTGTITINAIGSALTWTDVTGTSQAAAVNNGYTTNNAGVVTVTLPSTAVYGSVVAIVGKGAGGWLIAQNSGQTIHFSGSNTTTGAGGSLASTTRYDVVYLLNTIANTDFTVVSSIGNITVV